MIVENFGSYLHKTPTQTIRKKIVNTIITKTKEQCFTFQNLKTLKVHYDKCGKLIFGHP